MKAWQGVGRRPTALMTGTAALGGLLGCLLAVGCTKTPSGAPPAKARPEAAVQPNEPDVGGKDAVEKIDAIAERGSEGVRSLPMLLESLEAASPTERWHAARAIGMIGETAVSAIPKLIEHLGDPDAIVATQAAAAIGRIRKDDQRSAADMKAADGKIYEAAVKPLADAIVHKDPRVRRAAIRSLQVLHPDPDALAELMGSLLADEDPSVVLPAIHSLADMGPDAVPFLLKALDHPKARYWAELVLAEIGPAGATAVPKLVELVARGEPEERLQSIMSLAAIGEAAEDAAGPLLAILASNDDKDRFLHSSAIFALGRLRAEKGFEAVGPFLESDDTVQAAMAAWARARIHPDDSAGVSRAIELLKKGLSSKNPTIRQGAISGLADLVDSLPTGKGEELAKTYVALLDDENPGVRRSAAVSLVALGAAAVGPVTKALDDPRQRGVAIEILSELGPLAEPALPELIGDLSDADPEIRSDAAFAIGSIGPDAADAVPALTKLLDDHPKHPPESGEDGAGGKRAVPGFIAAYALGKIGAAAKPAVERLHGLVDGEDPFMATVAAWAGLRIEPGNKELYTKAIPLLTKALKSERDLARLEAAGALGDIGRPAAEAIPSLEMVAEDDPVAAVREAAEEALRRIR